MLSILFFLRSLFLPFPCSGSQRTTFPRLPCPLTSGEFWPVGGICGIWEGGRRGKVGMCSSLFLLPKASPGIDASPLWFQLPPGGLLGLSSIWHRSCGLTPTRLQNPWISSPLSLQPSGRELPIGANLCIALWVDISALSSFETPTLLFTFL